MDSKKKSYFQTLMKDVTPLRASKKTHLKKTPTQPIPPPKTPPTSPLRLPQSTPTRLSNPWDISDIQAESCLSFGQTRLQAKQFKRLKQGEIRPEAKLDLHGLYLEAAEAALLRLIQQAREHQMHCVLIIHGKGGRFHGPPILKAHVNHWLKQLPEILAFHSATPRDGGCGAVYVLLSTNRATKSRPTT
jgi:DNA-nicking Smr family endonuclease